MLHHHRLVTTLALVYVMGFIVFMNIIRAGFSQHDMTWGGVVAGSFLWPLWAAFMTVRLLGLALLRR